MRLPLHASLLLASILAAIPAAAAPRVLNNCAALTEPGSYVVGRNLSATGDCFVVQADFVTVDLDGFVITGNGTGSAFAESLSVGRHDIVIRNGVITGFASAVGMGHSNSVSVDRITATANTFNALVLGDTSTVTNSRITNNNGLGMLMGARALVTGNTVNENQGAGINVGTGSSIIGNAVGRNQTGIFVSEGGLVVNNVSRNNRSHGIIMDCPGAAIANTTSQNLGMNFTQLAGACDPTLGPCCVVNEHNSTISAF
jgi:hypothetical protein